MGSRDKGHKEQKKPKKSAQKIPTINLAPPTAEVEVIRKGKKDRGFEEE